MGYDPARHHRRSIRLAGYDYRQAGAYYVTICVQHQACLFGTVDGDRLQLSPAGAMVASEWEALQARFPAVRLDAYVVMPNHLHGIITLSDAERLPGHGAPRLGDIVGAFKSTTTVRYSRSVRSGRWPPFPGRLWLRNYYEHIIRDDAELCRIRQYVADNPLQWADDVENPQRPT